MLSVKGSWWVDMSRIKPRYLFIALIGFSLTQLYQNCGQFGNQFEAADFSSTSMGSQQGSSVDLNHPNELKADPPKQKVLVGNKEYVAQLMREIFTSTTKPVPGLEDLIQAWIYTKGAQYGYGCDPYSTWSGRDCGGPITNSAVAYYTEDNTVRESFRIQFCENILGMDQGVEAVLEKINRSSQTPEVSSVAQVYELFYRTGEVDESVLGTLIDLDRSLAKQNESVTNRWRAVILQVCESSGWQQL